MMTNFPYAGRTALSLAADLRSGAIDAAELTEATLAAIAAHKDQAIFIELTAKRARSEADAARKRLKAGQPASALDGIPIGWKDLFGIAGRVTTAGSLVLKGDAPAVADAALVALAAKRGMVSVGCLNMTEFAYSGIGLNPHYGTPRNPRDPKVHRAPGGSSSASGAVVAAGLLPIALGTDTGGSIRIPAAFNGVVGYKTSTGHYPMDGVFPLSKTLDTLGPLANTVADCIAFDAVVQGRDPAALLPRPVGKLRLIVPTNVVHGGAEPAVAANFEAAIGRLEAAGAIIERRPVPAFEAILELIAKHGSIVGAEALHVHGARVGGPDAASMDQRVVKRILTAASMSAVDLLVIIEARQRLIAETNALTGDAFFAFPTTPHVAPAMAPLEADMDVFFRVNAKTLRNTMLGNFLDWCGVAVPSGVGDAGMPTSFLLSAPHGRDQDLLAAALGAEQLITQNRS